MSRAAPQHHAAPDHDTIRGAAKRVGIGERVLREAVRRGDVPLYRAPGAWPRVAVAEVVAWLRAHRAPVTDHAERRLAEVLEREDRRAS